jgi:pimeloyl-ACP methyl ester carboxylesterase
MVLLPGAYHRAEQFIESGFAAAVSKRALPLDLVLVDLEFEHLQDRSSLEQLRREVLSPIRAQGKKVWIGGISLGGMLALDYVACHRTEIDGLCLLAPYLGNRILTGEIANFPTLAGWEAGELAETDEERRIWRYIKERGDGDAPLYLGFGEQDRFAPAHRLLARSLPKTAVRAIEGGHDWATWAALWEQFLDLRWI